MKTHLLLSDGTLDAVRAYCARAAQSVLLAGPTGTGKSWLARDMAADLLGTSVAVLDDYPYIRWVVPQDGKIAIEQVRELSSLVRLAVPGAAPIRQVIGIIDADVMTREAQNALLKLLEEPPIATVLILTASQPRRLLPTIRSRVQTLPVRLPEETLIVQAFTTKDTDSATVQRAWRLAHGSVARLVDILAKKDTAETAVQLAKRLLAAEPFERLSLIDTELKDKQRAREAVDALVMIASASLAPNERLARWQRVLTAGVTAQQALAQNANQKLALTELMLAL